MKKSKTDLFIILYPRGRNQWGREAGRTGVPLIHCSEGGQGRANGLQEEMWHWEKAEHSALYWLGKRLLPFHVPHRQMILTLFSIKGNTECFERFYMVQFVVAKICHEKSNDP